MMPRRQQLKSFTRTELLFRTWDVENECLACGLELTERSPRHLELYEEFLALIVTTESHPMYCTLMAPDSDGCIFLQEVFSLKTPKKVWRAPTLIGNRLGESIEFPSEVCKRSRELSKVIY